ncbi:SpoIIE family protein phosphatase [Streptomyces rimosus]|uniref:SpoIIE family protein phosphatase n=1 Tax=Streptomyces rimosus TaxID=1927 RepID=UPI000D144FAE|nr:SpoIIE family protein phosphatase [Streptomyces rimosus]
MARATERTAETVEVGIAQRPGTEAPCADGAHVHRRDDRVCAAVVDGAGHRQEVVDFARHAPSVITLMGMAMGGLVGLTTAGRMTDAYDRPPHMSAVYASMEPGHATGIHWIGDCRAYGWDGEKLTQWSTDQTMGQWLRWNGGVPIEIAETQDNWARLGLAQATEMTCRQVEIPEEARLVLLVSDGISDQVDQGDAEELCRVHGTDPQALADALVAAAEEDEDGYRDDATVVALLRQAGSQPAAAEAGPVDKEQGSTSPVDRLTRQQRHYVACFAQCASMEEIADRRGVSRGAVLEARRQIMKRLDLTSPEQFEAFTQQYGDEAWEKICH